MKVTYITPSNVENRYAWSGLVHFMAYSLKSSGLDIEIIDSLQFPALLLPERLLRTAAFKCGLLQHHGWTFDPRLCAQHAKEVSRRIDRSSADIIFTSGTVQMALLKTSRPIVFWTDATFASLLNYYFTENEIDQSTLLNGHKLEQMATQKAALGIYSSTWAAESAMRDYQMHPKRIQVVPFGANLKEEPTDAEVAESIEKRPSHPCRLLFIGFEWKRKGGDIALALVEKLRKDGLPCELTIAGCDVPRDVQLPDNVKSIGFINKFSEEGAKLLGRLLGESHFFILPSRADCTPIVFSEANSYGVPILSTATGGIPSVVTDGVNGFCFPINDDLVSNLAKGVMEIMAAPDRYRALARSSRTEYVTRLNWKSSGSKIRDLLTNLRP